jgi:hypothetical protein
VLTGTAAVGSSLDRDRNSSQPFGSFRTEYRVF